MTAVPLSPLVEEINSVRYSGEPDEDLFADKDIDGLWETRREVEGFIAAARSVLKACDGAIAEQLGEGGKVRLDDYFVRYSAKRTPRVYNAEGLWDWLGLDARECFNPNTVRVSSIKAIAEKRGSDPEAVLNSFVDYKEDDATVAVVPLTKAPKYAQELPHGEIKRKAGA